jgi:hypothetical protein
MPKTQQLYDHDEMSLRGRIGAHRQHSRHSPHETTKAACEASWARYLHEADPDGTLSEEERWVRAKHAQKAHMLDLALRSAHKRKRKGRQDPMKES